MAVGIASAAIYSILTPISESEETFLSIDDLNKGTGYMFLMFGWGCLICQPLAQQYGKRPMYLFSLLATMVRTLSICDLGMAQGKGKQARLGHKSIFRP